MPEIKSQHQCVNLDDLKEAESFGEPIGELPKQMDSGFLDREDIFAGTWECEPGVLKLDLDVTEFYTSSKDIGPYIRFRQSYRSKSRG